MNSEYIHKSTAISDLLKRAQKYAETNHPVLIFGESGVGKELLARQIHDSSPRSGGPFVPVNCGAIPTDLFESELFNHELGAFTGAKYQKIGFFERANKGTLFMDEIDLLSLPKVQHSGHLYKHYHFRSTPWISRPSYS